MKWNIFLPLGLDLCNDYDPQEENIANKKLPNKYFESIFERQTKGRWRRVNILFSVDLSSGDFGEKKL